MRFVVVLACAFAIYASGAAGQALSRPDAYARAAAMSALGRKLFFEPALSASGKMACATCHDPAHAFGPADARAVALGGADLRQSGVRAVPSFKYLQIVPQFTEHFFDSDDSGNESVDNGPTGGLTWDGRADRGRDQARFPLLSPYEMANRDPREIAARALAAGYGPALRRVSADPFAAILVALETFEEDAAAFYPYSSKYDAVLAGKAALTPEEARGRALFEDPGKGNCALCHISERGADGRPPQFTDYGYAALGAPRNREIPANADPAYFDLGLCGPLRTDLAGRKDYCGMFITPTLRNVALRQSFFHNGVFHSLRDAVAFYASRETDPAHWYPKNADGTVRKYDDLPPEYAGNVDREPPFDRAPGDPPALDQGEIDDIVAFLKTLTDGYRPTEARR
ncbi:MAG TPA: cytochrome c peroxidase [Stellaceae bacterium]|nr:cytochrome c peroxidase [Stellaceae bacterium]